MHLDPSCSHIFFRGVISYASIILGIFPLRKGQKFRFGGITEKKSSLTTLIMSITHILLILTGTVNINNI